jgi:hypothetical protein
MQGGQDCVGCGTELVEEDDDETFDGLALDDPATSTCRSCRREQLAIELRAAGATVPGDDSLDWILSFQFEPGVIGPWIAAGLGPLDVDAWSRFDAATAGAWSDLEFSPAEAWKWSEFNPSDASCWREVGFDPGEADEWSAWSFTAEAAVALAELHDRRYPPDCRYWTRHAVEFDQALQLERRGVTADDDYTGLVFMAELGLSLEQFESILDLVHSNPDEGWLVEEVAPLALAGMSMKPESVRPWIGLSTLQLIDAVDSGCRDSEDYDLRWEEVGVMDRDAIESWLLLGFGSSAASTWIAADFEPELAGRWIALGVPADLAARRHAAGLAPKRQPMD